MEATEVVLALFRAFPDLDRTDDAATAAATQPIGFVSRAWRPIHLAHAPVPADVARARVLDGPAWAGSVPAGG